VGAAKKPQPAKLFLACMYANESVFRQALDAFQERYGVIDKKVGPLRVTEYTDYYTEEMGTGIRKCYMTFAAPVERDGLAAIKIFSNGLERASAVDDKRVVNCDPGYVTNDKLVLATTKDFYHRIYLAEGIYAEVTLHYQNGRYRYFSWTYPDYKAPEVLKLLESARAALVHESRKGTVHPASEKIENDNPRV
jgi:hypothetical protein